MTIPENNAAIRAATSAAADSIANRTTALQKPAPKIKPSERPGYSAAKAEYTTKRDKLEKTTQDFEAVFVGMMLKQMRKSVAGQNALFGNSPESKMYQDMLDDATAQHMSKVGTFGLAKVLFKTMSPALPPDPDK